MSLFLKVKNVLKNDTIRNGSLFSFFSFINKGINFLLLLFLANLITPAEYGYLNLFNTVILLVGYFIAMSSEGYISVSYFKEGPESIKNSISSVLFTALIVGAFLAIILLFWGESLSVVLNLPLSLLYFVPLICFFMVFFRMVLNYYRIIKNLKMYGILSCGNALLNFFVSIILVKYILLGWQGCAISQLGCNLIYGLLAIFIFLRKSFFRLPSLTYWKKMLLWGLPLIPHLATNFIRQGCDRYIINFFYGVGEVGLFSFALNLTNVIIMIGMGFNESNSVELFSILGNKQLDNRQKKELIRKQTAMVFSIYLTGSIIVAVGGTIFTPILLPNYAASVEYFLILSVYGFLQCLYFLYTNYLFYYKKNKVLMYFTFSSSILHLILSLTLTRFSLICTCLVYCLSQFIVLLLVKNYAVKLAAKELRHE